MDNARAEAGLKEAPHPKIVPLLILFEGWSGRGQHGDRGARYQPQPQPREGNFHLKENCMIFLEWSFVSFNCILFLFIILPSFHTFP